MTDIQKTHTEKTDIEKTGPEKADPEKSTSENLQRLAGRPAPEYGEYAPEGWVPTHLVSKGSVDGSDSNTSASKSGAHASPRGADIERAGSYGANSNDASSPASAQSSGQVPGVPHNLGAGGGTPPAGATPAGDGSQPPQAQASAPPAAPPATQQRSESHPGPFVAPIPTDAPRPAGGGRRADRVITILLLAFGALGALYSAASMLQLPASMATLAAALGKEGTVVPDSVSTLGSVGAIVVLAIYALNLIYSIQRLRAHKITFWVPLAAAVIAFIVLFAFTSFAMNQVPEVAKLITDPDAISKLLAYLGEGPK